MFNIISIIALALSLVGNLLINFKNEIGYIIWIVSNVAWIVVNVISIQPNYPQIIMYLVYIVLNIQGYMYWRKHQRNGENK